MRRPGAPRGKLAAMIRFLFRLLSTLALAGAVILAVVDATRTIAAGAFVTTPLGESWLAALPKSLVAVQSMVERSLGQGVWDMIVLYILTLPGFAVFGVLSLLLYSIGRRPERRIGPFAAEACLRGVTKPLGHRIRHRKGDQPCFS